MAKKASKPITPDEVVAVKKVMLPKKVFDAFNALIARNFYGNSAVVRQDEVVALLVANGLSRGDIFAKHWLDVEDVYRAAGWIVEYDKPGFNETYEPTFTFKSQKKL